MFGERILYFAIAALSRLLSLLCLSKGTNTLCNVVLFTLQEEKERQEKERQEKQDAEFEKLNPEFCTQVFASVFDSHSCWHSSSVVTRSGACVASFVLGLCAQFKQDMEVRQKNDLKRQDEARGLHNSCACAT